MSEFSYQSQMNQDFLLGKLEWEKFFLNTSNIEEPHSTLLFALNYFENEGRSPGFAVDLGSGTGRDTLFLLKQHWSVLAIDREQLAIDILLNRVEKSKLPEPQVMNCSFAQVNWPDQIDLVNASYSLPFCDLEDFQNLWQNITGHMALEGRFAGQFFGERHQFTNSGLTIFTKDQVLQLFDEKFEVEFLQDEEGSFPNAEEKLIRWHIFHVVAKKVKN